MTEFVRHRLMAAKIGVSMAVVGFLGGIAAKGSPSDGRIAARLAADTEQLERATTKVAPGSIGGGQIKDSSLDSAEIKNGSLLFKDLKRGEVYSEGKIDSLFLKVDDAASRYLKVDDAAYKYLKVDATAANAYKLDGIGAADLVHGQGSVLSNLVALDTDAPASLLTVPGLLDLIVDRTERGRVQVRNLSPRPIELLGTVGGTALNPLTVERGATITVAIGLQGQTLTLQALPGAAGLPIGTFTASGLGGPDTRPEFVGQAIVGPQ